MQGSENEALIGDAYKIWETANFHEWFVGIDL